MVEAYGYVRVSTKEQDELVQVSALEEFAKSRNITVVKYFIDKGASGAMRFKDRPAANELLKALEGGSVRTLLIFSLDRLGRDMLDALETLVELEERGVTTISLKEEFLQVLDPQVRRLILAVLLWVAEFERRRLRERLEAAWAAGKQKGRPRKVSESVVRAYLEKYKGLPLKAIWKIMTVDGIRISYKTLLRRVKELKQHVSVRQPSLSAVTGA
ncbi:MAG: recombinase family protein [Thermofilaceae archaeon]